MILEDKQLLDSLLQENLLQISTNNHRRTWEYYYEQYHKAFRVLLEIAKQKRYQTNCKFMPFLFIMRHSLELFLKEKISNTSTPWRVYGKSHNMNDLYQIANINEEKFLEFFDCLNCNSEGDCFRYLLDKEGNQHFVLGEKIEAFDACNYYCLFLDNDNSLTKDGIDKMLQWELTFHTIECRTLGIIGTQYDFAIRDILLAIKSKQISINDVYLPLLFLLRHCLEIKLKAAILDLGNVIAEEDRYEAYHTHSVRSLYDILYRFINVPIKTIEDPKFKEKSIRFQEVTEQYKDAIQSLDANSYIFRFPKDRKGNQSNFIPRLNSVSKILELYWESDQFLCSVIHVLFEAGVLNIGDDKVREYFE